MAVHGSAAENEKDNRRAVLPTVVAISVHVVMAALLLRARPSPAPAATGMASPEEVIFLSTEVAETPNRAAPAMATTEGSRTPPSAAPSVRAGGVARSAPAARETSDPAAGTGAPDEGVPSPSPDGVVHLEAARPVDLGLVGTNRFLPRSEAQTDAFAQKYDRDEALHAAALARDHALGLGPEGPVLAALADGTARSLAPVRGRAIFVASTDASGEVVAITLDETVGERTGWAEAGRLALAALKGKKLRLPSTAQRAVMKLEVVSTLKLPSGHDPGLDVSLLTIPIHKGEGKDATKLDLLNIIHAEKIAIAPGIQLPFVVFSMDVVTLQGDPVDIGAHPRRVIHTRALDTTTM